MLSRVFRTQKSSEATPLDLFQRATRNRAAGRYEEAAALVAKGLQLDPDNVVGLLLAGSLHAMFRETELAQDAFHRVLSLDPTNPRALLGSARVALERGEPGACSDFLRRALEWYPDFPEARALHEVVANATPIDVQPIATPIDATPIDVQPIDTKPGDAARVATRPAIRADRLRVPLQTREAVLARIDGTLIFVQPHGPRVKELAERTAQLYRLASATLARSGLGPLRQAVIEGAAETTYLRAHKEEVLSMALGRELDIDAGWAHVERVWANCTLELAREAV